MHAVANGKTLSFLWMNSILHTHTHTHTQTYTHTPFLSSVDGFLGCFHILEIINNAAMKTEVCVSFQVNVFVSFEYIPRS